MDNKRLVVLWTSGDRGVAEKMVFMYTLNAKLKQWWEEVCLIIWGPSAEILSKNQKLQNQIIKFIEEGIKVEACKACADQYGVSDKLSELGVEVKYMGEPLTRYIKDDNDSVVTF